MHAVPVPSTACCCCRPPGAPSPFARCVAATWHFASLAFAEHPLRRHRAWLGAVPPVSASEAVIGRGADQQKGGGGAGGKTGGGLGACFDAGPGAKRRLPFACINPVPPDEQPKRCAFPAFPDTFHQGCYGEHVGLQVYLLRCSILICGGCKSTR